MKTKYKIEVELDWPETNDPSKRPDAIKVKLNGSSIKSEEISDPVETRFNIAQGDDWIAAVTLFDL